MKNTKKDKILYLDLCKAKHKKSIVDYKQYFTLYNDDTTYTYSMLLGAPQIINVEGTYIKINDIPYLVDKRFRMIAEQMLVNFDENGFTWRLAWKRP